MKIHSLEIHNILSIEQAAVTFGDSGLVLVEGFDYDSGRANGAGKSAIFNALSFALYDKVPRRVTKSEIPNIKHMMNSAFSNSSFLFRLFQQGNVKAQGLQFFGHNSE